MNPPVTDAPDAQARRVLASLQHRPFAWISDVDGTLSPIAQRPEDAVVPPNLQALLRQIRPHVDHHVVVSGRAPAHALAMVGIAEATYIGNHGLSLLQNGEERTLPEAAPYVAGVATAAAQFERAVSLEGMTIENKGPWRAWQAWSGYSAPSSPRWRRLPVSRSAILTLSTPMGDVES
ncbi:MAG: hypothetical protein EXR43_04915 [Dehalococcoidia bacterium]|nr:hypothetical protein [Dehalococcoidia bacterium]